MLKELFYYSPDESGGSGLPEKVKLPDGKEISRDEAMERLANYDKLQAEYTNGQKAVANLEGQVEVLRTAPRPPVREPVADQRPNFDAQHAALDKELAELDVNKDERYPQKLADIETRRRRVYGGEREWDRRETEARIASSERRAGDRATVADRQASIDAKNEATFETTITQIQADEGITLTPAERSAVRQRYFSHVGPEIYGTWHENLRRFEYSHEAVRTAVRGEDSVYKRIIAKQRSEGRDEGLRLHVKQRDGADSGPGAPTSMPPADGEANYAQTANWLRTQPEGVQRDYLRKNDKFGSWYTQQRRDHSRQYA